MSDDQTGELDALGDEAFEGLGGVAERAPVVERRGLEGRELALARGVVHERGEVHLVLDRQGLEVRQRTRCGHLAAQVQSVFDDSGLDKRKQDAGEFFLRF